MLTEYRTLARTRRTFIALALFTVGVMTVVAAENHGDLRVIDGLMPSASCRGWSTRTPRSSAASNRPGPASPATRASTGGPLARRLVLVGRCDHGADPAAASG
jgi:hypothetical protein